MAATYEGWLYKLPISDGTHVRSGWKRRYCVLEGGRFTYYSRHLAKEPKGSISVANCRVIDASDLTKRPLSFCIIIDHVAPEQRLYLRAESQTQRDLWVRSLGNANRRSQAQDPAVESTRSKADSTTGANRGAPPELDPFYDLAPLVWTLPRPLFEGKRNGAGQLVGKGTCRSDDYTMFFEGEWSGGLPNGEGRHTWASGRMYTGAWQDGVASGKGRLQAQFPDRRLYEGDWAGGLPSGQGRQVDADGSVYDGRFVNGCREGHGTLSWANGNVYTGSFVHNQMCGAGTLQYANGDRYDGEFKESVRCGSGHLTKGDGSSFKGTFSKGRFEKGQVRYQDGSLYDGAVNSGNCRQGVGTMTWTSGDFYEGEFVDDHLSGKGILKSSNGNVYTGSWLKSLEHGEGRMDYANGNHYVGTWSNGKRDGYGEFVYKSGNVFRGTYQNGFAHGKGTFEYRDGSCYTGLFAKGKKSGKGRFVFGDGRMLEGEWLTDQLEGNGSMLYQNGDLYVGQWQNYKWHGAGEFRFAFGDVYKGEFRNGEFPETGTLFYANNNRYEGRIDRKGRRQGHGVMTWSNGEVFTGEFKNDFMHGKGTMIVIDGTQTTGLYSMGKCVEIEIIKQGSALDVGRSIVSPDEHAATKSIKGWFTKKRISTHSTQYIDFLDEDPNRLSISSIHEQVQSGRQGHGAPMLVLPTPDDARQVLETKQDGNRASAHWLPAPAAARKWSAEESQQWSRRASEHASTSANAKATTPAVAMPTKAYSGKPIESEPTIASQCHSRAPSRGTIMALESAVLAEPTRFFANATELMVSEGISLENGSNAKERPRSSIGSIESLSSEDNEQTEVYQPKDDEDERLFPSSPTSLSKRRLKSNTSDIPVAKPVVGFQRHSSFGSKMLKSNAQASQAVSCQDPVIVQTLPDSVTIKFVKKRIIPVVEKRRCPDDVDNQHEVVVNPLPSDRIDLQNNGPNGRMVGIASNRDLTILSGSNSQGSTVVHSDAHVAGSLESRPVPPVQAMHKATDNGSHFTKPTTGIDIAKNGSIGTVHMAPYEETKPELNHSDQSSLLHVFSVKDVNSSVDFVEIMNSKGRPADALGDAAKIYEQLEKAMPKSDDDSGQTKENLSDGFVADVAIPRRTPNMMSQSICSDTSLFDQEELLSRHESIISDADAFYSVRGTFIVTEPDVGISPRSDRSDKGPSVNDSVDNVEIASAANTTNAAETSTENERASLAARAPADVPLPELSVEDPPQTNVRWSMIEIDQEDARQTYGKRWTSRVSDPPTELKQMTSSLGFNDLTMDEWTSDHVLDWLRSVGLPEFLNEFQVIAVNGTNLRSLASAEFPNVKWRADHTIVKRSQLKFALERLIMQNPAPTPLRKSLTNWSRGTLTGRRSESSASIKPVHRHVQELRRVFESRTKDQRLSNLLGVKQ